MAIFAANFIWFKVENSDMNLKRLALLLIVSLTTTWYVQAQEPQLQDTTLVCHADSVLLDAGEGFISYLWNTDEQSQTIWAYENGWYHVLCTTDEMQVIEDSTFVFMLNATIPQLDTIQACYTYGVILCVEPDTLKYVWTSSDPNLVIENNTAACVDVFPELDTTTVYVHVSDSNNIITCVDSAQIWLYPRIRFEEVNQINTGCPGTCIGQLEVIVSGGVGSYDYFWPTTTPQQRDSIAFNLCESDYVFSVTDDVCTRDTTLSVEVFDLPEVEIIQEEDSVFIKNPIVHFSFENNSIDSIQIFDPVWNFGDSTYSQEENPTKVYDMVREYDVWLKYTTSDECIDSVTMKVDVREVNLTIPNVFTPNGDGTNDVFVIKEIENYISAEIHIFNRYGKKVYSNNDYQGDWDGGNLRDGVYFYVLRAEGYFGTDVYKGSLTILRQGRY